MSKSAPWLALSVDWQDSEMFDGANHGERLAFVCLLCFVKAQGRAGKVRFRDKVFAAQFRLTAQAIEGMLTRAAQSGSVIVQGDQITVVNWKDYQDPMARSVYQSRKQLRENHGSFSKKSSTHHPSPITHHIARKKPPTIEEVKAYFLEKKTTIDPDTFWAFYDANGWVQGQSGKPIKNWKSCLITWEKRRAQEQGSGKPRLPTAVEDGEWTP